MPAATRQAANPQWRTLPIHSLKESIVQKIVENAVTVIIGETGCGKTTQLPQFALDDVLPHLSSKTGGSRNEKTLEVADAKSSANSSVGKAVPPSVIVTQPRRIAAISMARRVAKERGVSVGTDVGFTVRFNDCSSPETRLRYVTDGILLREVLERGNFDNYNIIMIDEAHERSVTTDILLALLKRELNTGKLFKVIISSATMDAKQFSEFFDNAPIIQVPGTCFPVQTNYCPVNYSQMEMELDLETGQEGPPKKRRVSKAPEKAVAGIPRPAALIAAAVNAAVRLHIEGSLEEVDDPLAISKTEEVSRLRAKSTLQHLHNNNPDIGAELTANAGGNAGLGHFLIFLPGRGECEAACTAATTLLDNLKREIVVPHARVLALYGTLDLERQLQVFERVPGNCRKIIFCTNVAETAITVDGVEYVIDCGFVKQKRSVPNTGFEELRIVPISKSQAIQRAGRAGRVRPGKCFRLYTQEEFERFRDMPILEIERTNLSTVVLQLKTMGLNNILAVKFLNPPKSEAVFVALQSLFLLQAINGEGLVTELGRAIVSMPVDPLFGRCILDAATRGVFDEIVDITALCSVDSIFSFVKQGSEKLSARGKNSPFFVDRSDHLTLLNILNEFRHVPDPEKADWCDAYGISLKCVRKTTTLDFIRYFDSCRVIGSAADIASQLHKRYALKSPFGNVERPKRHSKAWRRAVLQSLCCGHFIRSARLTSYSSDAKFLHEEDAEPAWITLKNGVLVRCDPQSAAYPTNSRKGRPPENIIFNEVMSYGVDRRAPPVMRIVSAVHPEWIEPGLNRLKTMSIRSLAVSVSQESTPISTAVVNDRLPLLENPLEVIVKPKVQQEEERTSKIAEARARYLARKKLS